MDALVNAILRRVSALIDARAQNRWGTVTSVDPSRPAVRVELQPEGVTTGWLPIGQHAAGNGWGLMAIPVPGMMAFCQPDNGVAGHWVVTGFAHNDAAQPAQVPNAPGTGGVRSTTAAPAVSGEFILSHESGAFIRLTAAGGVLISAPTIHCDGNVNVNGSVRTTGNVIVGTAATGSFTTPTGQAVTVQDGIITNIE